MSAAPPLESISVGVLVERSKAESQWIDFLWRPKEVFVGVPETPPWTILSEEDGRTVFYAGAAEIDLYRTETTNYRDNLATGEPRLWVVLRGTGAEPPYGVFTVTADPAEGEAMTEAGDDLVDSVPMPEPIQEALAAFVAAYHSERTFSKRKRDRTSKEAMARRGGGDVQ